MEAILVLVMRKCTLTAHHKVEAKTSNSDAILANGETQCGRLVNRRLICFATAATITGSIGVAALRPTITPSFLDKIKVSVQSILTGSPANDLTQELSGKHLERYQRHVDEMYADFKNRVVEGREIHPELINSLAGGRVYTGKLYSKFVARN